VKRTGRDRFIRNVLIAIGNSSATELTSEVERLVTDPSPLVRGAAIWAFARLIPAQIPGLAAAYPAAENDPTVAEEWTAALGAAASRA